MARLEVALRSPLAFHRPGRSRSLDALKEPPDAVVIAFEGREFVWHPPMDREDEHLGVAQYGPMVSVVIAGDHEVREVAALLQRFLSAVAFHYDQAVEDAHGGGLGGSGETDPFHWTGPRALRPYAATFVSDAPAGIEVANDGRLRVALGYYREGLNAGSPFYSFLAFWNVLEAVFDVEHQTVGRKTTPEAEQRDIFIRRTAPRVAWASPSEQQVQGDLAAYFRDEARNALAHVIRPGRREIDPDNPSERVRLRDDSAWLRRIARAAIEERWSEGVQVVRHPEC